jgi:hypothetical protein
MYGLSLSVIRPAIDDFPQPSKASRVLSASLVDYAPLEVLGHFGPCLTLFRPVCHAPYVKHHNHWYLTLHEDEL